MKIFTSIAILGVILLSMTSLFSQRGGREHLSHLTKEQIQEKKKVFLTEQLQLSHKEADALMDILNDLDEQRFKLWQSTSDTRNKIKSGETLSDDEYSKYFEMVLNNRVREKELERTYYNKCKTVLPMSKLVKLERANRDFVRKILKMKH